MLSVVANPRKALDTEVFCPMSGMKIGANAPFPLHKVQLTVCVNGVLYAECPHHKVRLFIESREIVSEIMKVSTVLGYVAKAKKEMA